MGYPGVIFIYLPLSIYGSYFAGAGSSWRLIRIPATITAAMMAASTTSQPQYCVGWRRTRMKWRP